MPREKANIWYLKNLDAFRHLSDEEHKIFAEYTTMHEVKRRETLYFEGLKNDKIYILKTGAVKITKTTPQGGEIILDILSMGSIFGELSDEESHEKSESAVVVEDGLICTVNNKDFSLLLQKIPGLAIKVSKMRLLRRWRIENKLLDLLYRTVEQRLSATLLGLVKDFGVQRVGGYILMIKLTHKDFAGLVASTRETVTAALNKLKENGVIDFEGKYIIINSPEKLKSLIGNQETRLNFSNKI